MKALLPAHVRHVTEAIVFLGVSLLLAGLTSAKASVEVITCEASSEMARIAIDRQGRAAKDVRVISSSSGGQPLQSTLTLEKSGLVVLPRLQAGPYVVTAAEDCSARSSAPGNLEQNADQPRTRSRNGVKRSSAEENDFEERCLNATTSTRF